MGKTTMVMLSCPTINITQEFEISHAERILNMQNNGGWELADNKFEYDKEYGIRYRRNKAIDKNSEAQIDDKQGDKASE